MPSKLILKEESIAQQIYFIRGEKVMLDFDLAQLYGVETRVLKQAVKRNISRFPEDFMFELTWEEYKRLESQVDILETRAISLRSQFVTLKTGRGKHSKYLPYAFTEQGVAMLSGILKSKRAIEVNISIMRTFVRMRKLLETHKELAAQLKKLEEKVDKQDRTIHSIFEAIRQLMATPTPPRKKVGFKIGKGK